MAKLLILLVLTSVIAIGSSLKCYQCTDCSPNFITTITGGGDTCIDIPFTETRCSKAIDLIGNIIRSCGTSLTCSIGEGISECNGEENSPKPCISCCSTDNCNGSGVLQVSALLLFVVVASFKIIF